MLEKLISECSDYDFKEELEEKKPRSWLKSVSAFANGVGGSLFFGVANDRAPKGLKDPQYISDKVSELINQRIDPKPFFLLIPFKEGEMSLLQVKVLPGQSTPYYYKADGVCLAYIRSGNESVEAPTHILNELILKGSGKTFDSVVTGHRKNDYSFSFLTSTFLRRTGTRFEDRDFVSFGLATQDGLLTNAGLLFSDDPPFRSCRLFATRWNGRSKVNEEEASDDREFRGSILKQLDDALSFFKANTKIRWRKVNGQTIYQPEYDEGAVTEALVNAIIHRDYNNPGAEVALNIYDDRIEISSPGGMFSGERIPEVVDYPMESLRRNPVIADLFWRMGLMNRRGSGLENITLKTNELFHGVGSHVRFQSGGAFFKVAIDNAIYDIGKANDDKKDVVNDAINGLALSETEASIVSLMRENPKISMREIAEKIGVTQRTVARKVEGLKKKKVLEIEGATKSKTWVVKG